MENTWNFAGRIGSLFFALIFIATFCNAQVKVTGGFISDSVKIGEETRFYLSARYPEDGTLIFPDSTFDYFPFDFISKKYFPTETENGISVDSAVYYLSTFEIDPQLGLVLPAYLISDDDSSQYLSNPDTIRLIQTVTANLDSIPIDKLPLKMNTAYHKVNFDLNVLIILIVAGSMIVIAGIVWISFGKKIRRYFKAKRLQKRHSEFVEAYNRLVSHVQSAFSPTDTERALAVWKKYMEQLESRPYTKLTSREMHAILRDENLGRNLRELDKAIYGSASAVVEPLWHLKAVADQHYHKKLAEVKHGK